MEGEHRLKERVELSLDNRQIFYLFVASAAVVSVVFALGVVVGKRLVSTEAPAAAPTDPLALLDQLGQVGKATADDELTFHEALTAKPAPKKAAAAAADPSPAPPPAPVAEAPAPPKPAPADAPAKPEPKPEPKVAKVAKVAAPPADQDAPAGKKAAAAPPAQAKESAASGSYTLQLSSFQDRTEAERFMERLRTRGLKPHMVPAQIPDRGTWYRVRVGSYRSWDEAVTAKARFERTEQVIAYVARLGT